MISISRLEKKHTKHAASWCERLRMNPLHDTLTTLCFPKNGYRDPWTFCFMAPDMSCLNPSNRSESNPNDLFHAAKQLVCFRFVGPKDHINLRCLHTNLNKTRKIAMFHSNSNPFNVCWADACQHDRYRIQIMYIVDLFEPLSSDYLTQKIKKVPAWCKEMVSTLMTHKHQHLLGSWD